MGAITFFGAFVQRVVRGTRGALRSVRAGLTLGCALLTLASIDIEAVLCITETGTIRNYFVICITDGTVSVVIACLAVCRAWYSGTGSSDVEEGRWTVAGINIQYKICIAIGAGGRRGGTGSTWHCTRKAI